MSTTGEISGSHGGKYEDDHLLDVVPHSLKTKAACASETLVSAF
jgi:hypothetical protein